MLVGVSYLSLLEVFRDFVQLVSITVQSLGIHIDVPMKFSFVSISDWLSINFVVTVGIDKKVIMGIQMALLIVCTFYLIILTIKESSNKFKGLEVQTLTKFQKYFGRAVILIITTIFAPLAYSSLKVLSQKDSLPEEDVAGMHLMSVISLILLVIVNPILFYYGIKNTRPHENTFDTTGGQTMEKREIYFTQLKRHHNPFKELYNNYSHQGAYYKLVVMLFKFVRMCLLISDPAPYKNVGAFWGLYLADVAINFGFLYYIVKIQPYHDYRTNRSCMLNCSNQLMVIFFNIVLLNSDDEEGSNKTAQVVISFLQLICCLTIFCLYYFKTLFASNRLMTTLYKKLFKEISFTSIKRRGFNSFPGIKNRFLNYIYFNPEIYNKEQEIRINVWEEFWNKLIKSSEQLKSKVKAEELVYAEPGLAPPYLLNFQNTAEERLEENMRIMQKIGRQKYEEELKNNERKEYIDLKVDIFKTVPPVDAYYKHHFLVGTSSAFCKVNFFPFPFTCQLVYDEQIIEVQGEDYLKHFLKEMKTPRYNELREFRLILRTLNDRKVEHKHSVQVKRTKVKTNSEGKKEVQRVDATIFYSVGLFQARSALKTLSQLSNGQIIDVGKGLVCSLYYETGRGVDVDGDTFEGGSCTLSEIDLQISYTSPENSTRMNQIIRENRDVWEPFITFTKQQLSLYSLDQINNINQKAMCLSYDFNIRVLGASYDVFMNKQMIEGLIKKESNEIFKYIVLESSEEFKDLYKQLDKFKNEDFKTYIYFVFKDIWTQNQDLSIVKQNYDLLNPDHPKCIIHEKDFDIQKWKEIFIEKKLRSKIGRGYFGDKLLRNFQKMIDKMHDKPDNFINQSDIMSVKSEKELKTKAMNNQQQNQEDDSPIIMQDLENPGKLNENEKGASKVITISSNKIQESNTELQEKEVGVKQLVKVQNKEIQIKPNINRRTSIEDSVFTKKLSKEQTLDENSVLVKKQSSQGLLIGGSQLETGATIKKKETNLEQVQEINLE